MLNLSTIKVQKTIEETKRINLEVKEYGFQKI